MIRNHLYAMALFHLSEKALRWFLFSFLFVFCAPAKSQSFHYFKYEVPDSAKTTYVALLTVFLDGTAEARVRNEAVPVTKGPLFDLTLLDSTINFGGQNPNNQPAKRHLVTIDNHDFFPTQETLSQIPLFEFTRETNSTSPVYSPTGIFIMQGETWVATTLLENKSFAIGEIGKQLPRQFYSEGEINEKSYFSDLPSEDLVTRGLSASQKKAKIWMILVTDTRDETIGKTSMLDKIKMSYTFTNIAEKMKLANPVITYVDGFRYSKAAVEQAIANLKPGPDDIVVFYYSGHGYRKPNDSNRAPNMVFTKDIIKLESNSINVQWVANQLTKKRARLNLIISDCCNEELVLEPPVGRIPIVTPKSIGLKVSTNNFVKLFLEQKGTFIASAADRDQFAIGNPELGGFFTYHFSKSLEYYVSTGARNSDATWDSIFFLASINANTQAKSARCGRNEPKTVCVQQPWYHPL